MRRLLLLPLLLASCRIPPACVYPGAFTTDRGEFVVCGDTREWIVGEAWRAPAGRERRAVFAKLVEERPDFVLNTGDLVAAGGNASGWATFDAETAALREAGIAYFPVLGNHDLWPDKERALANWFARFPFLDGGRWYDVRHGYVDLIVLDTNSDALTPAQIDDESAWLDERLAAADADPSVRCVFLAFHHSPYTNSFFRENAAWVIERFVAPARRHAKVRAFFTGHVHSYEHFADGGVHFVVSGGGGAPLMDVGGPSGRFRDLYDGPRGHHFVRVVPRDDRVDVEVEMLAADDTWFRADAFSIGLP